MATFDAAITFDESYYDFDGNITHSATGPTGLSHQGTVDVGLLPQGEIEVEVT